MLDFDDGQLSIEVLPKKANGCYTTILRAEVGVGGNEICRISLDKVIVKPYGVTCEYYLKVETMNKGGTVESYDKVLSFESLADALTEYAQQLQLWGEV
ncbi:hypothetical protein LCGC14_2296340 [marine sediment metagenome]|uniref:Uncharacterized protein n=1 Tax=marine sediment metagenome TaxID=412755 RepID=A0A0F9F2A2_9ZZZZ